MIIRSEEELKGMQAISDIVALTLRKMIDYTKIGMSTLELDAYGKTIFDSHGAVSAPIKAYGFPGNTCISVNSVIAHGIPNEETILKNGDLINIDVSAELNGYYSDNGCSFILGDDIQGLQPLVDASKKILNHAISIISGGTKIAEVGKLIENQSKNAGYKVIKDLGGHGIGRKLHEDPDGIMNYYVAEDKIRRFRKDSVVAIETFIATKSNHIITAEDGWTLTGDKGGFVAQHEHTLLITSGKPIVLTALNGI